MSLWRCYIRLVERLRRPMIEPHVPYSAKAVANYFIDLAKQKPQGGPFSPLKLQKILYYAHGWHLAMTGGNPLLDEQIEAWQYGPVVPSIYHEFKEFGNDSITNKASGVVRNGSKWSLTFPEINPEDKQTHSILNKIWDVYGKYTATQLSNSTHNPGTPWHVIWEKEGKNIKGTDIPNPEIQKYFEALAKK